MFSERSQRALLVRTAWVIAPLALVSTLACGRKADPKPPPSKNPARTRDLTVRQQGTDLILVMGYPAITLGGLALPGIDRVTILHFSRPALEFMERAEESEAEVPAGVGTAEAEPPQEVGAEVVVEEAAGTLEVEELSTRDLESEVAEGAEGETSETEEVAIEAPAPPNPYLQIFVDPDLFRKSAELVLTLEGAELDAAVIGGRIYARVPVGEIQTEPPVAHSFSVQTAAGHLESPQSAIASFVPLPPPNPPADVKVVAERQGVRLTWTAANGNADGDGDGDEEIAGYQIYRKAPAATLYGEPLSTVAPDQTEYLDRSAQFGASYVYAVTTVRMKNPLVESWLSSETEIDYVDDFAPAVPTGLVLLAEVGSTRLVWESGAARDIAGYLVFVSTGGGEMVQLTAEPVRKPEYIHQGTVSGATYTYTVVAVDTRGNRSEPSAAATTRSP